MKGLHPHLGLCPGTAYSHVGGIASKRACGLHQQRRQPLGRAEVALNSAPSGCTAATSVMRRKSWPLASSACPPARPPRQRAPGPAAPPARPAFVVSASMGDARAAPIGPQLGSTRSGASSTAQCPAHGDVRVAAGRAGARHAHGETAVVAAQRAVVLWNTWCALQCGQSLFQPQSTQCSTGA